MFLYYIVNINKNICFNITLNNWGALPPMSYAHQPLFKHNRLLKHSSLTDFKKIMEY